MRETLVSSFNIGLKSNFICIKINLTKKNLVISKYLFQNGFINSYFLNKSLKFILLYFTSFYNSKPVIYIKKISLPGRKVFISYHQLKRLLGYNSSYIILSTNKGIMTNREAVSRKLGGEFSFIIKC
jgi:ribosomal protein S8